MGDRLYRALAPGAPAVDETQDAAPDSRLRALAQRRVLQRKAQKEVSQPGDAAEVEADAVADAVVDGKDAPEVGAQQEGISRKPTDEHSLNGKRGSWAAKNGAAPEEFTAQTEGEAMSEAMEAAPEAVLHVIDQVMMGLEVEEDEKKAALDALDQLNEADLSTILRELQRANMMDEFMEGLGEAQGEQMMGGLRSEFRVPAVAFGPVDEGKVDAQFASANQILNKYGMKVVQAGFKRIGKQKKGGKPTAKSLIGNDNGTIHEDELEADGGAADKIIDELLQPGMVTSFWFTDIIEGAEKSEKGQELLGRALTERFAEKHRGKEAVFIDANQADPQVLAHELGHILGGNNDTADHVTGDDGTMASGDEKNVMFQHSKEGQEQLTPEQVAAFKTSIYARISRAPSIKDMPVDDGRMDKRRRTA